MELDLGCLRAIRVLGRGATGTVFLVADSSSPWSPPFALKVVDKLSSAKPADSERRARWELSVLSNDLAASPHPFLPSLLGQVETPSLLAWGLPFCPAGDLHSLRLSLPDHVLSPSSLLFYLSEVLAALSHLHSLRLVYRDLKPENILIQANGHLTLTDFDLSRRLNPPDSHHHHFLPPTSPAPTHHLNDNARHHHRHRHRHRRNLTRIFFGSSDPPSGHSLHLKKAKSARVSPVSRRRSGSGSADGERSHSFVGTEEYVSPEVVRGDGHGFAVDWWALGILTYEMAYGRTPFKGRNRKETFRNVLTRQPELVGRQRTELTDLISRLLVKDPAQRLGSAGGADEVKAHPFFKGVRWDMLAEVTRPPFLATLEELEEAAAAPEGDAGFDVRDYMEGVRREKVTAGGQSPLSLTEF